MSCFMEVAVLSFDSNCLWIDAHLLQTVLRVVSSDVVGISKALQSVSFNSLLKSWLSQTVIRLCSEVRLFV